MEPMEENRSKIKLPPVAGGGGRRKRKQKWQRLACGSWCLVWSDLGENKQKNERVIDVSTNGGGKKGLFLFTPLEKNHKIKTKFEKSKLNIFIKMY